MTDGFEFATATRVLFGAGKRHEVVPACLALGLRKVLLVTGHNAERAAWLVAALEEAGLAVTRFAVAGEPTVALARAGVAIGREAETQGVVALGGGSSLDAGKAIAALLTSPHDLMEHLEVVGRGRPLAQPPLPLVAIPTTAGTGSEVTRNAVLVDEPSGVKASLRSRLMLPRLAVVDPELLQGLPPAVLAASGMDALSQVIEPFLSTRANPLTDALAGDGIARSVRSLRRSFLHGSDPSSRHDLALVSLLGGICLANAGLGAVHGFAAPLGGMFQAPHGAVCAALLPPVLHVNLRALRQRQPGHPHLDRFRRLAVWLTGASEAQAEDAIPWVDQLRRDLQIPTLSVHGVGAADLPPLVEKAEKASSMRGNPVLLTRGELTEILERALG